uniref:Uncharacterized protein n=1 Tax=Anguilla anguilla TaxID=7936 RepID=A0A0E9UW89_ANGAN
MIPGPVIKNKQTTFSAIPADVHTFICLYIF